MSALSHLDESCIHLLELDNEARCAAIREDSWVKYPLAEELLKKLNRLLLLRQGVRTQNMLVLGRADNGKTTIMERFLSQHPVFIDDNKDSQMPVMAITMPHAPTDSRMYTEILKAACIPHRENEPVLRKSQQAIRAMKYLKVKMLLIDNFNHISLSGGKQHRATLAMLKNLGSELKVAIVGFGTRDSATALGLDEQMTTRFDAFGLNLWELNADYQRLLASLERLTPLNKPSKIWEPEKATLIYQISNKTIGGTVATIKEAAEVAVLSGEEVITTDILNSIQPRNLDQFSQVAAAI
jgi:hypothetical protein